MAWNWGTILKLNIQECLFHWHCWASPSTQSCKYRWVKVVFTLDLEAWFRQSSFSPLSSRSLPHHICWTLQTTASVAKQLSGLHAQENDCSSGALALGGYLSQRLTGTVVLNLQAHFMYYALSKEIQVTKILMFSARDMQGLLSHVQARALLQYPDRSAFPHTSRCLASPGGGRREKSWTRSSKSSTMDNEAEETMVSFDTSLSNASLQQKWSLLLPGHKQQISHW